MQKIENLLKQILDDLNKLYLVEKIIDNKITELNKQEKNLSCYDELMRLEDEINDNWYSDEKKAKAALIQWWLLRKKEITEFKQQVGKEGCDGNILNKS